MSPAQGEERRRRSAPQLPYDPGIHAYDPGDPFAETDSAFVVNDTSKFGALDEEKGPAEDSVMHLVQDDETIAELHHEALPPDEYYEALEKLWKKWWPGADPLLLEHMMSVLIAFDTATVFAMSFGISKFSLAQIEAKLVGEIVGRMGRSPNPAIVRAIKAWPPIYTLKQLQEFLGTINYVRPHCGPEYARVADPIRPLLKLSLIHI